MRPHFSVSPLDFWYLGDRHICDGGEIATVFDGDLVSDLWSQLVPVLEGHVRVNAHEIHESGPPEISIVIAIFLEILRNYELQVHVI